MASCFSCFTVKIVKDFCVMAVTREKSRLVPLKAIPTGNPTPLANAAIETPPVITVDVIRPLSVISLVVLNGFIFSAICSRTSISLKKCLNLRLGSCGAVGFNLDNFWSHCRICSLFI